MEIPYEGISSGNHREKIINGHVRLTLFMLATRGDNHDLSSIYGMLMKITPETSNTIDGCKNKRRLK